MEVVGPADVTQVVVEHPIAIEEDRAPNARPRPDCGLGFFASDTRQTIRRLATFVGTAASTRVPRARTGRVQNDVSLLDARVSEDGAAKMTSHHDARDRRPPREADDREPRCLAHSAAATTFALRPLVLNARRTSAGRPNASTWREKISLNEVSFLWRS